jgi:hypothetical protein
MGAGAGDGDLAVEPEVDTLDLFQVVAEVLL